MAPPKKAAKKALKKAAKKAAKKSTSHHEARDTRRAYEHLGRVEILQNAADKGDADVVMLAKLAQVSLRTGESWNAAHLLRAAEHLSFARLAATPRAETSLGTDLIQEILAEVDHLKRRAEEHAQDEGTRYPEVIVLAQTMLERAQAALAKRSYRQSLEFSRGAEALTHVVQHGSPALPQTIRRGKLSRQTS